MTDAVTQPRRTVVSQRVRTFIFSRYGVFGILSLITIAWCAALPHGSLIGDDLILVRSVQSGRLDALAALAQPGAMDKYRPVSNLVFAFIVPLVGNRFGVYEAINIAVQSLSAILVASITLRATRGNLLLAFGAGLVFATSQFAYYQIAQVLGLFEALALLCSLLAIYHVICAYQLGVGGQLRRAAFWAALAILSDERYLAFLPFVVLAAFLYPPNGGDRRAANTAGILALAVGAGYYALKHFVFGTAVVTATSGYPLMLAPSHLLGTMANAVLNILGFNRGPDYLAGKDVTAVGWPGYLLGVLSALGPLAAIVIWFRQSWRQSAGGTVRVTVLAVTLLVPLLASASASMRLEFRWLYVSEAIFILIAAAAAGNISVPRRRLTAAVVASLACLLGTSVFYRQYARNVYLFVEMKWGYVIRAALAADRPSAAVVVTHGDNSLEDWTFQRQGFVQEYGFRGTRMVYVPALADANEPAATTDVFDFVGTDIVILRRATTPQPENAASNSEMDQAPGYPDGIGNAAAKTSSGIYPEHHGENCCWSAHEVSFSIPVPPGDRSLVLKFYVPKAPPFEGQGVSLVDERGRVVDHARIPLGDRSTVVFALPRHAAGTYTVHLRFDRSFVPSRTGGGGDTRELAALFQGVSVR